MMAAAFASVTRNAGAGHPRPAVPPYPSVSNLPAVQGRGQARIEGVKESRLGGQGHDQFPVTPQHELRPGEGNELHVARQVRWLPRTRPHSSANGLHPHRVRRGRAHHRVPRGPLCRSTVPREDRRVAEWQGAEGKLYLSGPRAGPHKRVSAQGVREGSHRSTRAGKLPLQRYQVGAHRRVV